MASHDFADLHSPRFTNPITEVRPLFPLPIYVAFVALAVLSIPALYTFWNPRPTLFLFAAMALGWWLSTKPAGPWLQQRLLALSKRAAIANDLPDDTEIARVNLLRIVIGLLFLFRSYAIVRDVFESAPHLSWHSPLALGSLLMLAIACSVTFGILTPLFALIGTIYLDFWIESLVGAHTLGTDVFVMVLLTFTFLPCGTALSVDAWLARRSKSWARLLTIVYAPFGAPSTRRSNIVRFLSFMSYGILCLYSVVFHLTDSAWIDGFANVQALTSNFLGRESALFQSLYDNHTVLAIWLSKITGWAMILWELLLVPLVLLSRPTRILAIVWGLLFFTVSRFCFILSYLPYYEFVLWTLLWAPAWGAGSSADRVEVFFDDRCNLCDRTMRVLMALDLFHVIVPRPVSASAERLRAVGLSEREALKDLYSWDEKRRRLRGGYDFYLMMSWKILLLLPVHVVLRIADWLQIGRPLYRFIADRRTRLFGVCEQSTVPTGPPAPSPLANAGSAAGATLFDLLPWSYVVLALLFVYQFPIGPQRIPHGLQSIADDARYAAASYGIVPINVFNQTDLRMSSNFTVVHRIDKNGNETLVPYQDDHGRRLGMDNASDRMFYGVSVAWRRAMRFIAHACYRPGVPDDHWFLSRVVDFDRAHFAARDASGPVAYRFTYYYTEPWNYDLLRKFEHQTFSITRTCSVVYDVATGTVTAEAQARD